MLHIYRYLNAQDQLRQQCIFVHMSLLQLKVADGNKFELDDVFFTPWRDNKKVFNGGDGVEVYLVLLQRFLPR